MITIGTVLKVIQLLCMAVEVADKAIQVAKKAGFFTNTTDVKELGDKALVAKEMGIDEPTDPKEYKEYIKKIESIEVDPKVIAKYSDIERTEAGCKVLVLALDDIYPDIKNLDDFIREVKDNPDFYNTRRMEQYLRTGNDNNMDMREIGNYFSGELENDPNGMSKERRLHHLLTKAEQEMGGDGSDIDVEIDNRCN